MGSVTSEGLIIRRFPEILEDIEESERENIDPNIYTGDDEVLGQLNSVIASALTEQEELGEAVNDNFNLLRAEGIHLDNLVVFKGITRNSGARSYTDQQQVAGVAGTIIPAGSLIENSITGDRFSILLETTISTSDCYSASYVVETLLDSTEYTISINGNEISFTSDGSATAVEILNGLKAYNDATYLSATWTLTVDVPNEQLVITTTDENNLNISSITYIGPETVTVFTEAECTEIGLVVAPSNAITKIVTPIFGWESTTNSSAYVVGRERETDDELRTRALDATAANGKGTVQAIQDSLRNVTGVTSATVVENDEDIFSEGEFPVTFTNATNIVNWTGHTLSDGDMVQFRSNSLLPTGLGKGTQYFVINSTLDPDEFQVALTEGGAAVAFTTDGVGDHLVLVGIPRNAFESVVQGGDDDEVALTIWRAKPAGIKAFGRLIEDFLDDDGVLRFLRYTRPSAVELEYDVEYELYDEETAPSALLIESTVQDAIINFTSALTIGQDVIPNRALSNIYAVISGIIITSITVRVKSVGSYVADRLSIDIREFPVVVDTDITVTDVT